MRVLSFSSLLIAALIASLAAPLLGADAEAADGAARSYKRMPWHLVDVWWDIGQAAPFESLAFDVTVSDVVPASVKLYIAPIGLAHLGETPFYGGIQTQADGYTRGDGKLRGIGPGFLLSMWGQRSPAAIRPADGGFFQSSGHEGDFVSARRPYVWTKGKFTYRVTRMDQDSVDGKPGVWVGAFVYDHERDQNLFVGALRFPGEKLMLKPKIANFVEIYGAAKPVSEIPKLTVTFGPPVVNGVAVENPTAAATYPQGVPDYAEATARDGSLPIRIGEPVERGEQRTMKLLPVAK